MEDFEISEIGIYKIRVEDGTPEGWCPRATRRKTLNQLAHLAKDAQPSVRGRIVLVPMTQDEL